MSSSIYTVCIRNPRYHTKGEILPSGRSCHKSYPPGLKRKADHFSFEVANTDLVKGNNTWNVLKFTPFLKVDDMTGIEMIGKGKITVYINGRKSHFTGNALKSHLESLPAEEIMNVEITTMANSTFRAQDSGGSINIILKKMNWKV